MDDIKFVGMLQRWALWRVMKQEPLQKIMFLANGIILGTTFHYLWFMDLLGSVLMMLVLVVSLVMFIRMRRAFHRAKPALDQMKFWDEQSDRVMDEMGEVLNNPLASAEDKDKAVQRFQVTMKRFFDSVGDVHRSLTNGKGNPNRA
jgi:hypothetical protein